MGRLPTRYANKEIKFRIPYTIPGEVVMAGAAQGILFPDSTFLHNVDKPFEIHRVLVDIIPMTDAATPLPPSPVFLGAIPNLPELLRNYVRIRVQDTSKNEMFTKAAQLVSDLVRDNTGCWEWEEPYTVVRSEGLTINVDSIIPGGTFSITVGAVTTAFPNLRVAITLEGFLLVIEPPSETR